MCSIWTPSEPVVAALRDDTVYVPGSGLTVPGHTVKVRRVASLASTSHTRFSPRE